MEYVNSKRFLKIASALTTEREEESLMAGVLREVMAICKSQKGVLFLWQNKQLVCQATLQADAKPLAYEPHADSFSDKAFHEKCSVVINDFSSSQESLDAVLQNEDLVSGSKTCNLLAVPMLSHSNETLGVIRITNAHNAHNDIISITEECKDMSMAVAGLAAIALENLRYTEEIRALLASFVHVVSATIDERTPFNANHTRNMAKYAVKLLSFFNQRYEKGIGDIYFSSNHRQQFMMSVWLHDMGKMVIPNGVMNKDSKLGRRTDMAFARFDRIALLSEIHYLKGELTKEAHLSEMQTIEEGKSFVRRMNDTGVLHEKDRDALKLLSERTYREKNGELCPWLTPAERQCLSIEKGTLTEEERHIMEKHVVFTEKLLNEIDFSKEYCFVPIWAIAHHEYLDGTGYPKNLKGSEIPREVRLLTILDIFDALIASDRPYKEPMILPKALSTLREMADNGKLDSLLVNLFIESKCWEPDAIIPNLF